MANSLNGDLDTIIVKALKKSPAERYATANAFDEDIARFLRGDVVLAQRDSVVYRAVKFARRHRFGIAAAGVLLLTLAAGLAATSYEAEIAQAQRDAALQSQLRSLTQTAAARLVNADVPAAMGIILEVLPHRGAARPYTPEALSVFQRARAADAQLLAFTGHRDRVRSVAFSPDARRIVTACWDKTARIWDAATGQELARLSGHADRVWSAAFSPDGRRVVTASHDRTARIWDAATGQELMRLSGHADRVTSAAFSPDGRHVVTGSYDKTARIWDAATGQQLVLLSGHTEMVMSGAFSADGRQVVTASHDRSVRIWDAATGHQIRLLNGHTDWVLTAAFSPDGLQVLTASSDKTARPLGCRNGSADPPAERSYGPIVVCGILERRAAHRHGLVRQDCARLGRRHGSRVAAVHRTHGRGRGRRILPRWAAPRHSLVRQDRALLGCRERPGDPAARWTFWAGRFCRILARRPPGRDRVV